MQMPERYPVGIHFEKIFRDHGMLRLSGVGREQTVLSWGDGARAMAEDGNKTGTFRSYTLFLGGKAACVKDLTVENTAGPGDVAGQAVAVYADAPLVYMENVHLRSRQDTLFCAPLPQAEREPGGFRGPREHAPRVPSTQYYHNCLIEGDVDFIFGGADAVFDHCEIRSLDKGQACNGYAAAPSGEADGLGFVFRNCTFTTDHAAEKSVYLARPWRPYGKASFLHCTFGAHLAPELFAPWAAEYGAPQGSFALWQCVGPGMPAAGVLAASACILSDAQAAALSQRADMAAETACAPWQDA